MLTMVIEKPIQLTMVRADPTKSWGAVRAMIAENWGESPTTTTPQKIKPPRKTSGEAKNTKGETRQQMPDPVSWIDATGALPALLEIIPPSTQPRLPPAMIQNAQKETLISVPEF